MGMNRKTAHSYPHKFKDDFGQVRDCIILETTWLGSHEPYSKQNVHTFIVTTYQPQSRNCNHQK
jgi:hypothetical protein